MRFRLLFVPCLLSLALPAWGQDARPALPPVRVKLTALGSPTRLVIRSASPLILRDAATGDTLDGGDMPLAVSAQGKQLEAATHRLAELRVEAAPAAELSVEVGKTRRTYPGALILRAAAGRVSVLNECDLESYTVGVLAGECPALFQPQAIRANAVAVRSYSYRKAYISRTELCDTTHCQVYQGTGGVKPSLREAVKDTEGIVALHEGEVIDAVYCSDCGGMTEANEEAWKGARPLPYLRPVLDAPAPDAEPYCAGNRTHAWKLTLPLSRLQSLLGKSVQDLTLAVVDLSPSGRARAVQLGPERPLAGCGEGEPEAEPAAAPPAIGRLFHGEQWRRLLGLTAVRSLRFSVKKIEKGVEISGTGWGHGVGLCQFGANGQAKAGATYEQILKHYYTGIELGPAPTPSVPTMAREPRR